MEIQSCINSEETIVSVLMNYPEAMPDVLSVLDPSDFTDGGLRVALKEAIKLYKEGQPFDYTYLHDKLNSSSTSLVRGRLLNLFSDCPGKVGLFNAVKMVKEKSTYTKLMRATDDIYNQCMSSTETGELFDSAQSMLNEIALDHHNKTNKCMVIEPSRWTYEALADFNRAVSGSGEDVDRISTGFDELDDATGGPRSVNIIAAGTGVGKTAFALNIARNMAVDGTKVMYVNYEMAVENLRNRLIAIEAEIPYKKVETGKGLSEDDVVKIKAAIERLSNSGLLITGDESKTISATLSLIHKYSQGKNPIKAVFIDYLGEMSLEASDHKVNSEYVTYGNWVQLLKNCCQKYKVKLYVLVQQNRLGSDAGVTGVGGSFKIPQKADVYMVLVNDKKSDKYWLKLEKNRHGPYPMSWQLKFNKDTQKIKSKERY